MGNENGEWIMFGLPEDDPGCLHTVEDLIDYVNKVGFVPLFRNELPGFSVEEHTAANRWWSDDDEEHDPWCWRQTAAASGKVAYGKFFNKKAGFLSLEWLPYFVNFRRDGYDFDARWDDGRASYRARRIMEQFDQTQELYSYALKELAGFGKDGEKNFEGTVTDLQMQTYLAVRDFRSRLNKKGIPYGWKIAVYSTPEQIWGRELVTARYSEAPEQSLQAILAQLQRLYPDASEAALLKAIR